MLQVCIIIHIFANKLKHLSGKDRNFKKYKYEEDN